jgi:hypothetical protein
MLSSGSAESSIANKIGRSVDYSCPVTIQLYLTAVGLNSSLKEIVKA